MQTLLIIDDNKDILENLSEFFGMEGYKILVANNGKKGVEIVKLFLPDLIICDVLMLDMNGHEVLHEIIDIVKIHRIPFIFSTSLSENTDRNESLQMGADEYIVKPFEMETLLLMVRNLLQNTMEKVPYGY